VSELRQKLHLCTTAKQSVPKCDSKVKGMQDAELEWKSGEEHHD